MDEADLGIEGLSDFKEIGSGGFGKVYVAYDSAFGRPVAVKVLHNLDDAGRRRFDRERLSMGRVAAHPNVVTPYGYGYTSPGGWPYITMEYLRGGSLQDTLDAEGPLQWETAVGYLMPVADALGHGHSEGILHRDVKPANILLSSGGVAKLTDFGISTIREATATQSVGFSLAHASPETFAGGSDHRDERSDLYSLASTLFNLVAGQPPFHRAGTDSELAYIVRIAEGQVPPLGLGPDIDRFMATALAKDPAQRPPTASHFIHALAAIPPPSQHQNPAVGQPQTVAAPISPASSDSWAPPHAPHAPHAPSPPGSSADSLRDDSVGPAQFRSGTQPSPGWGQGRGPLIAAALAALVVVLGAGGFLLTQLDAFRGDDTETRADDTADGTTDEVTGTSVVEIDEPDSVTYTGHIVDLLDDENPAIQALAALPDGRQVSASADGTVQVWDPDNLDVAPIVFTEHRDQSNTSTSANDIGALAVLPDGRVASGADDGTVRVWNPDNLSATSVVFSEHADNAINSIEDDVLALAALPDGRIASGSIDGTVRVWWPDDRSIPTVVFANHINAAFDSAEDAVTALAVTTDGRIASGSADGTVRVWDPDRPTTGTIVFTEHADDAGNVSLDDIRSLAALPDGRIASGSRDGTVRVWNPDQTGGGTIVFTEHADQATDPVHGDVWSLAALQDGRVASGSADGTVLVWHPDRLDAGSTAFTTHRENATNTGVDDVRALMARPDGRLASGSRDGTIWVWTPPQP